MIKAISRKSAFLLCIFMLVVPFISGATNFTPQQAASGGKQIVFILGDPNSKITSITISGYNQRNEWTTWSRESKSGLMLAYTKDYWWTENFVEISFVVQDNQSKSTSSKHCLIDALVQPKDSPRVEIVYKKGTGCAGGDAGSAQDPVKKKVIQPIKDSFAVMNYYSRDFNVNEFLRIVRIEAKATLCIVGVGTALRTGGLSYAAAAATINGACEFTATEVLKLFIKP